MKKIAVFIFSFVVLACYGRAKMEIRNETCFKIKAADDAIRRKVEDLKMRCTNPRQTLSEKNNHAEFDEGNGVYVIRLFESGTGAEATSTQVWLILNADDKSLKDVALDPIKPIHLKDNPQLL